MPANNTTEPAGDIIASYFMERGSQYYTVGRFAMHAQCFPVCGNLLHHAVEMLLKGGLAQKRAFSDLKRMGHKLDVLWQAFKVDFPDTTLQRHDDTISGLNKFEETRYANPDKVPSMMGVADWFSLPVDPIETSGELPTLKKYNLVVGEIDDLVATCSSLAQLIRLRLRFWEEPIPQLWRLLSVTTHTRNF